MPSDPFSDVTLAGDLPASKRSATIVERSERRKGDVWAKRGQERGKALPRGSGCCGKCRNQAIA
jgi:hypothetical protein